MLPCHVSTLVLCWTQLVDDTAAQWVPIGLNLGVHVLMYCYYALATIGQTVWWKRHLTTAQIVQFAVDVPACAAALLLRVRARPRERALRDSDTLCARLTRTHAAGAAQVNAERGWGWFGGDTLCRGTHRAAYVGIGLLAVYLVLFIQLYIDTYVTKTRCGSSGGAAARRMRAKAA